MSLAAVPEMMTRALYGRYAVGYFESWNLESLQGVVDAAEQARAPVIIGLSLFPLTAPIVMFLRIVVGAARTWEILLSIGLQLVTIFGVIWLSAKIFRVGLLMSGKRFKFAEVIRLARM